VTGLVAAKWLRKLRLSWFEATRAFGYGAYLQDHLYRVYLGHAKVIHFRDGQPVFSLSTPALYSRPAANMLARSLYRVIQNRNIPNLFSFAVTDRCNATCAHCSFYGGVDDPSRTVLTLEQCRRLIADAQQLGVSVINIVGGEPLLRPDLPGILRSVDKDLSTVTLFTNGTGLAETAPELKRAGLDGVYVSIDAADEARHDALRGEAGMFRRAIAGIDAARRAGLSVGLAACLSEESFRAGEFPRLVDLAREAGAHEVLVFDAIPTGRLAGRADLGDGAWVEELVAASRRYHDDWDYPGVLIYAYTTSYRSVGCSCGTSYFYVTPYGDVCSCDFNHEVFGNVLETPLHLIWDRLSSDPGFRQAKWDGCRVKDPAYRGRWPARPGDAAARTPEER